jgi:hypothetical protein
VAPIAATTGSLLQAFKTVGAFKLLHALRFLLGP